ncbi:MAG: hypothetical protein KatS3mg111_2278 [Pirellulaceae bacterium]|nr:MAG: hypothetical protein KatS3mg111_2278 [Pirellulaceae bacterium]
MDAGSRPPRRRHDTQWKVSLRHGVFTLCLLAIGNPLFFSRVFAEPPSILSVFRKRTTLDAEQLALKAEHGPWLILAITLTGDDAQEKAVALANELRQQLRQPAFVWEHERDDSPVLGSTTRLIQELDGSTTQYRAWRQYANPTTGTAYAVLVGEFTSTDDPRIKPTLQQVRALQPRALQSGALAAGAADEDSSWLVKKYRAMMWNRAAETTQQQRGPMGAAFLTRNPLLPEDYFQGPKVDDFVEELNKQVEYSLLECPGRFTVRVASFQGFAKTSLLGTINNNEPQGVSNALDVAAEQANRLTLALREKGVEAYQFHDRYGSYVTIGSFEQLGRDKADGSFEYLPEIVAIMKEYCGYETVKAKDPRTGAVRTVTTLKSLERVPFDVQAKPMAVPRRITGKLYGGSLLGR